MTDEELREAIRRADAGDEGAVTDIRIHYEQSGEDMPHRFFRAGDVVLQKSCTPRNGPWRCRVESVADGQAPTCLGIEERGNYSGCHKDKIVLLERVEEIEEELARLAALEAGSPKSEEPGVIGAGEAAGILLRKRRWKVGLCVMCGRSRSGNEDICRRCEDAWKEINRERDAQRVGSVE